MARKVNVQVSRIRAYEGHTGSVFSLAVDEEEKYMYTSGDDGIVARWNLRGDDADATGILRSDRAVYSLTVSSKYQLLFAGSSDGTLYIQDLEKKQLVRTYRKVTGAIYHLLIAGDLLWICQAEGFLTAINMTNGKEEFFGRLSEQNLRIMIPALGEGQFFIGSSDHQIYLFDFPQRTVIQNWSAHENSVFSLLIHPDGKYLLSGSRDAHFNVWDLQNEREQIKHIPAHNFTVNYFALSPDGHHFVTASRDKTIKLWDAYDFSLLKVVDKARHQGHTHSVNKVIWLKHDNSLISTGDDRQVLRWKFDFIT
ncbi:MAG: WD40 repeat domain-containing protein [Bacteroidota bacterium]